jgi:hypothetical protein
MGPRGRPGVGRVPAGHSGDVATNALADSCQDILGLVDDVLAALPATPADTAAVVRGLLGSPPDLVVRAAGPGTQVLYLETIVQESRIEQAVLRPLLRGQAASGARVSTARTYGEAADALLAGSALVVAADVRSVSMDQWPHREPSEPPAEIVAQGPHVGFVENLEVDVALIRQHIRDRRLRWVRLAFGARAHTPAALLHLEGLARPELVANVEDRFRHAARHASFAVDASMLQEWLTNVSGWLFPTMQSTERPDVAVAALLEGRVVVLVDGSPVAIIAPTVFAHLVQVPMDYYNRSFDAWLKRVVRLGSLLASLLVSPLFVAVLTVNQELIPNRLFVSIAQTRLGVPLPAVAELLLMEIMVEMVREAGTRMPGSVGQTVSILGAIVIGQSAVIAGLVSAPVVVVVAVAYIASTVVPSVDARVALRFLRFPLILLAAWLGLFGLLWGLMVLFVYLLALESCGVPYLAPVAPHRGRGLQDTIRRRPLTDMRRAFMARRRGPA